MSILGPIRRLLGRPQVSQPASDPSAPAADGVSAKPTPTVRQDDAGVPAGAPSLTRSQLRFLRCFRQAADLAPLERQAGFWETLAGGPLGRVLAHWQRAGLVTVADLQSSLVAVHSAPELQQLCRDRGLPHSGTKAKAAARLVKADEPAMRNLATGHSVYRCTEAGQALVLADIEREDRERRAAEAGVRAALDSRDFARACRLVAQFEAHQPIPRGVGMDWAHNDMKRETQLLSLIYTARPAILADLSDDQLAQLRAPAALMLLWGTSGATRWLPNPEVAYGRFDRDTAARMLLFWAYHRVDLAEYAQSGVVRRVKVLTASDACPVCKRLGGKSYTIPKAPQLPHPECRHEMGCRCTYVADI